MRRAKYGTLPKTNEEKSRAREYLEARVKIDANGCWIWQKNLFPSGYAQAAWQGVSTRGHRLAWAAFVSPIPASMFVCHTCDVKSCLNPEHLFVGTVKDNVQDTLQKGKWRTRSGGIIPAPSYCSKGHAVTGRNAVARPNRTTVECRECLNTRQNEYRRRRRATDPVYRAWERDKARRKYAAR